MAAMTLVALRAASRASSQSRLLETGACRRFERRPNSSRIGDVIAALRAKHPLIHLDLQARPASGTRQGLKSGELDIGLLLARPTDPSFHYHEVKPVRFRIGGPVAWKAQIESANWADLASLPWITPTDNSMAYALILNQLFTEQGLELNTVIRFDNVALARAMVRTGVGMMLMREEHALQGEAEGYLARSPIAHAEISFFIIHLASRKDDPLIRAFVEAAKVAWPQLKLHGS